MVINSSFKKIAFDEKKRIKAGGFNFWNAAISISLIGSSIKSFIELIFKFVNGSNQSEQSTTNLSNFNNGYSEQNIYLRLSKYPSKSNIMVGV